MQLNQWFCGIALQLSLRLCDPMTLQLWTSLLAGVPASLVAGCVMSVNTYSKYMSLSIGENWENVRPWDRIFASAVFCCTGVNLWCNSAVTFNKHIAPRSASDILITLITMQLWIAFQKPSAPFIHGALCLRSLHGGVIHRCSLPLYSSCINTGECKFCVCKCAQVYVHVSTD